ncbi:hypothetical protein Btru_066867 [Bulinus truncatus]|nr:hypothetical protein Btru_066867 [Bulinus truncatus]
MFNEGNGIQNMISLLNANDSINTSLWQDSDDSTCITSDSIKTVTVTLTLKVPFFFIRLVVSDTALRDRFIVSFDDNDITFVRTGCRRQRFTFINSRTVDVRCDNNETVKRVILQGKGVTSLCSIYVSAGRNMALKQAVQQLPTTGTMYDDAVDGDVVGGRCTSNERDTGMEPIWTLLLKEPVVAGSFEFLLGGKSDLTWLFYRSIMETFDENDSLVYNFTFVWDFFQHKYIPNINKTPIKKLSSISTRAILPLCEVHLFGECTPGKWGLDCQLNCSDSCPDSCSEWDGSCPTGCLGYYPPKCRIECPMDKWGVNCIEDCSDRCQYKYCNSVDGLCTAGCNGYSDPPYCTIACMKGYYGFNCASPCSLECPNGECDHRDGRCGGDLTTVQHETLNATDQNVTETGITEEFTFNAINFGIGIAACAGLVLIATAVAILIKLNLKRAKTKITKNSNGKYKETNSRKTNVMRYVPPPSKAISSIETERIQTVSESTPDSYYEEIPVDITQPKPNRWNPEDAWQKYEDLLYPWQVDRTDQVMYEKL